MPGTACCASATASAVRAFSASACCESLAAPSGVAALPPRSVVPVAATAARQPQDHARAQPLPCHLLLHTGGGRRRPRRDDRCGADQRSSQQGADTGAGQATLTITSRDAAGDGAGLRPAQFGHGGTRAGSVSRAGSRGGRPAQGRWALGNQPGGRRRRPRDGKSPTCSLGACRRSTKVRTICSTTGSRCSRSSPSTWRT